MERSTSDGSYLFRRTLHNWQDWSKVFQSADDFSPLIRAILNKEHLPWKKPVCLPPGTNAVFRCGSLVLKIFAPAQAYGKESSEPCSDCRSEVFSLRLARSRGIFVPEVLAEGVLHDRYDFWYLIEPFLEGTPCDPFSLPDRKAFGKFLRRLTDSMDQPCEVFSRTDVFTDPNFQERWKMYRLSFQKSRRIFVNNAVEKGLYGPKVFVHGDLNQDNLLLQAHLPSAKEPGQTDTDSSIRPLCVLDFGDAVLAPYEYEQALAAVELMRMDPELLSGYFEPEFSAAGSVSEGVLAAADIIFRGILIHDFGGDVCRQRLAKADPLGQDPLKMDHVLDLYRQICRCLASFSKSVLPFGDEKRYNSLC